MTEAELLGVSEECLRSIRYKPNGRRYKRYNHIPTKDPYRLRGNKYVKFYD